MPSTPKTRTVRAVEYQIVTEFVSFIHEIKEVPLNVTDEEVLKQFEHGQGDIVTNPDGSIRQTTHGDRDYGHSAFALVKAEPDSPDYDDAEEAATEEASEKFDVGR